MPLFGSKFSPKKAPVRKNSGNIATEELEDLVLGQRSIQLRLGNQELVFDNGDWIPGKQSHDESFFKIFIPQRTGKVEQRTNQTKN